MLTEKQVKLLEELGFCKLTVKVREGHTYHIWEYKIFSNEGAPVDAIIAVHIVDGELHQVQTLIDEHANVQAREEYQSIIAKLKLGGDRMTILLTVSPKEAVELLNGNATSLVRSWKVPLGTAYIGVSQGTPRLIEVVHKGDMCYDTKVTETFFIKMEEKYDIMKNTCWALGGKFGKIVAKCEITKCEVQYCGKNLEGFYGVNGGLEPDYKINFTSLSVLDKPMEVGKFYRKPFKDCKANCEELPLCSELRLTRLPSRWQEVEVGE